MLLAKPDGSIGPGRNECMYPNSATTLLSLSNRPNINFKPMAENGFSLKHFIDFFKTGLKLLYDDDVYMKSLSWKNTLRLMIVLIIKNINNDMLLPDHLIIRRMIAMRLLLLLYKYFNTLKTNDQLCRRRVILGLKFIK